MSDPSHMENRLFTSFQHHSGRNIKREPIRKDRIIMKQIRPYDVYILPLSSKLILRIIDEGKRGIVKYMPRETMGSRFVKGTKIIFYETGGRGRLLGEATIKAAKMVFPKEVLSFLGSTSMLSKDELWNYVNRYPNRMKKRLLSMIVSDPLAYESPPQWTSHMSMVGRILSFSEYEELIINKI